MGCCASSPVVEDSTAVQQDGNLRKKEMPKEAIEALTAEGKTDALLAVVPGRIFANSASNHACIFTQQGRKGTNQDAMVVWEGFASMEDTVFCGVFDGHGPLGHLVARRVRDSIPSKLVHYWQEEVALVEEKKAAAGLGGVVVTQGSTHAGNGPSNESVKVSSEDPQTGISQSSFAQKGDDVHIADTQNGLQEGAQEEGKTLEPPMFAPWRESHLAAYRVMDNELRSHPGIDCFCSGTTAVTVLKQGQHLVIGNVGDSRAIMGTKDDKGGYLAVQLTVDLKPNLPREAERIRQCRGRVFALHDEPEVPRVWLPFDDSPGLAMARAFGDFCLKDYGVIAVPELSYRQLTGRDQFIVLATDGIWDVLSNDEVVQVIAHAPTRATAARALVEAAVRVWRLKYPTSKVDDCAVVCLFLDRSASKTSNPKPKDSSHLQREQNAIHQTSHPPSHSGGTAPLSLPASVPSYSVGKDPQTSYSEAGEISNTEEPKENERKKARGQRSLADWLGADDDEEWSALEGVTRVNSLLNLPRFQAGDKRAGETSQRPS